MQVEAELEESTKAEVRHLKSRLVDADQEVCKLQDRLQEALNKLETSNSDLAHAKVRFFGLILCGIYTYQIKFQYNCLTGNL